MRKGIVLATGYAVLLCFTLASGMASAQPKRRPTEKHPAKKKVAVTPDVQVLPPLTPVVPLPSPPPRTLAEKPAVPPQVSYRNGQLRIVAPNSTLSDILRAVRQQTGATVDVPPNATERVAASFGPGPARDVLAALLNGTHFNYVMVGSANSPGALERIVLMPKTTGGVAPVNQAQAATPPPQNNPYTQWIRQQPEAAQENVNDDVSSDDANSGQDVQPDQPSGDEAQQDQDQQQQPNVQPNVKTPEQLLMELQRRQMQRQQQQNQGAPQGFPIPPQHPPDQTAPPR